MYSACILTYQQIFDFTMTIGYTEIHTYPCMHGVIKQQWETNWTNMTEQGPH